MTREELIEALNEDDDRNNDSAVVILALVCGISGGMVVTSIVLLCRLMGW